MQAQTAANTRQFGIGPVKNVALALGIFATVVVGAATVAVTRNDDTATVSNPARSVAVQPHTYSHWRIVEMNELPAASAAVTLNAANIHFREINMLPEASVAAPVLHDAMRFLEINMLPEAPVAPMLHETMRFLEINQLPVVSTSVTRSAADIRFWEMNQLPGNDVDESHVVYAPGKPF
jgi:hypothetical protein